jgi:probable H4MPT-linked C1 transfer pathway protein
MPWIVSLDIGGANTKACGGNFSANAAPQGLYGCSLNHAVYRDPQGLAAVLQSLRERLASRRIIEAVAVTMTAELCDVFGGREEGVRFIVDLVEQVYASAPLYIWTVEGVFSSPQELRKQPLRAAAANWLASANALATSPALAGRAALWADMGSTTTDLLLLHQGSVLSRSRTDLDRLLAGELLYSGALRTSLDTLCEGVYIDGALCPVAHEYFACTADVYRYLELIEEREYDIPTPDQTTASRQDCARRLARMVASTPQELGETAIRLLAMQFYAAQRRSVDTALLRLLSRKRLPYPEMMITDGQGAFLLQEAARELDLPSTPWWSLLEGARPDIAATVFCLGCLLSRHLACTGWPVSK